jgi:hypothetical protein
MLQALCLITRLKFPEAEDIVAVATETEPAPRRSEDLAYFDARIWTEEHEAEARRIQAETGLLAKATVVRRITKEYPDPEPVAAPSVLSPGPNPRNKLCPCGSGLKYKKCHGR